MLATSRVSRIASWMHLSTSLIVGVISEQCFIIRKRDIAPTQPLDELNWKIVNLAAKRGHIGATREDFFIEIRGLVYEDLEEAVLWLEREGYLTMEWMGPNKFLVMVTEKGSQVVRQEYEKRLDAYRKRIEEQRGQDGLDKV